MATLTNTKIKDTYDGLLKTTDNDVIGASEKVITDGLGNASVLSIGTASASFSSDVEINGLTIGKGNGSLSTNIAFGVNALDSVTSGVDNTAIGHSTMQNLTLGVDNAAFGTGAMVSTTTGSYNTSIGSASLPVNTTGQSNTAVGLQAMQVNTTGGANTVVGMNALNDNTEGNRNTTLGFGSGNGIITGSDNIHIGYNTTSGATDVSNEIVIGSNTTGNGSNTATYGNSNITDHYFDGNITLTDATNPVLTVEDTAGGSSFLRLLAGDTGTSNIYLGDATDDNAGAIVYDHSDNSMSFRTNGFLEKMSIDSSGNVLIGTGSAYEKLTLRESGATGVWTQFLNDSDTNSVLVGLKPAGGYYVGSNGDIQFNTGGTLINRMTITAGGDVAIDTNTLYVDAASNNIGIGVQPRTSGVRTLEMPNWVFEDNGAFGFKVNAYYDGTNNKYINTGAAARLYSDDGYFAFFNAPSGTAGTNVTFEERMRIDSSGNLNLITSEGELLFYSDYSVGNTDRAKIKAIGAGGGSGYGGDLTFHTKNTSNIYSERMRIDSSGNVGIGTTPSEVLHLYSTPAASSGDGTALQITSAGAGGDQAWIGVNKGAGNGLEISVENRDIIFNTGATSPFSGSERMRITSGGDVLFGNNGSLGSISDSGGNRLTIKSTGAELTFGSAGVADSYMDVSNGVAFSVFSGNDNTADLGRANARFKDIYLGGNIYLGGTAAANALDDYEEGTFTPFYTASGGGSASYSTQQGKYTKIGNVVNVIFWLRAAKNTLSGDISVGGFPFAADTTVPTMVPLIAYRRFATDFKPFGDMGSTQLALFKHDSDALSVAWVTDADMSNAAANYNNLGVSFSYFVN